MIKDGQNVTLDGQKQPFYCYYDTFVFDFLLEVMWCESGVHIFLLCLSYIYGDGGTVVTGVGGKVAVEQQVQFKKKFLNLFPINQLPPRAINIV